jgi:hypothetical protein
MNVLQLGAPETFIFKTLLINVGAELLLLVGSCGSQDHTSAHNRRRTEKGWRKKSKTTLRKAMIGFI